MNWKMISLVLASFSLILSACYRAPEVVGFDSQQWKASLENCDNYRLDKAQTLIEAEVLKGEGQNAIQELLGPPNRHELYQRNQKFFYYDLNCAGDRAAEQLRVRFDALGNLREVSKELKP